MTPALSVIRTRLGLGIEPLDAVLGTCVARRLMIEIDGRGSTRTPVQRHTTGRHALVLRDEMRSPLDLRIYDHRRGYVPRRLRIELPDLAEPRLRIHRPVLFPGMAWDLIGKATALRSRVWRARAPVRWARIEAHRPTRPEVVLRTQADDRGEFLLVLAANTVELSELESELQLDIHVFGPPAPLPLPPGPHDRLDPLWDLPVDVLALPTATPPSPAPTSDAHGIPSGWITLAVKRITLAVGRTTSDQNTFVL